MDGLGSVPMAVPLATPSMPSNSAPTVCSEAAWGQQSQGLLSAATASLVAGRQLDGRPCDIEQEMQESFRSHGSATNSMASMPVSSALEDGTLRPSLVDVKRLQKLKAEQEARLKAVCTRVDRLTAQEQRVWKDVAFTQQRSLCAQEKQWARQAQQAERLRMERELLIQEQALRERAREMRLRTAEMKDAPRRQKFEENQHVSAMVREETKRASMIVNHTREQSQQEKAMRVEVRRQQRRQARLQQELDKTRKEAMRSEQTMQRYLELQEEIQNAELAIAVAEREEMSAVNRLQNSQSVRSEVLTQLQDIEARKPQMQPEEMAPPPQTHPTIRSGLASSRNSRSSPRLSGGGSHTAPAGPPEARLPPQPAPQQPHRLHGGLHSSRAGFGSQSMGRMDLSQITEEEVVPKKMTQKMSPRPRPPVAKAQQRVRQSPPRAASTGTGGHMRTPPFPTSVQHGEMQMQAAFDGHYNPAYAGLQQS